MANKRRLKGSVVSDASDKTVVVLVKRRKMNTLYGKAVLLSKKYHAHDENNQYKLGDEVIIEEHKPISKLKTWIVLEKVSEF